MKASLEELFCEAEKYGVVTIFGLDSPGLYRCKIEFNTIEHVRLEASSDFELPINEALIEAIEKAIAIVNSVGGELNKVDTSSSILLLSRD
jgi:hypothetical protein